MNSNIKADSWAPLAFSGAMLLACALAASTAFADDQVANRSSISSYKLKKRCLGFTNRG